jgi:hypothetical protein
MRYTREEYERMNEALRLRWRSGLEIGVALGFITGVALTLITLFVWGSLR